MLDVVVHLLCCPHDGAPLALVDGSLGCAAGHRFDVARQGYVNLLTGPPPAGVETAAMVAARAGFQDAGHLDPLTAGLVEAITASWSQAPHTRAPVLVDLGAGTGHHLARLLDAVQLAVGIGVDLSKHAARRAARAHPRIGAVVADVWGEIPIRDGVADVILVVFAPRNAAQIGRILRPDGTLVVVTPAAGHLAPLVERLGLLGTEPSKLDHLDAQLAEVVAPHDRRQLTWHRRLHRYEVAALVASGPNAWHTAPQVVRDHLAALPEPSEVRFAVTLTTYRR